MRKKILAILIVVIIAVAAVSVAALFLLNSGPKIKIGLVACMDKAEGQDMYRAASLAVKQINNAGGIFISSTNTSLPVELVLADTKDDSAGNAVSPVTKAIEEDKVDLLIGGYTSAGTLADEVVAVTDRVPYIITGGSSNLVTRRVDLNDTVGMSYMFHYCTTTRDYSETVVKFFNDSMKPLLDSTYSFNSSRNLRLAVIYRDDAFGRGVDSDTKSLIQQYNLSVSVVAEVAYPTTTTTFGSYLRTIKDANPDAVYVVDFVANTAEIIKEGLNNENLHTVYIGAECAEDPTLYTLLGQSGDKQLLESKFGMYAGPPYYLQSVQNYVTSYQQEYSKAPGMMGADTYDAFFIAKNAIERAGTLNKTTVRDALENTSMDQMLIITQTGKIKFSTGTNYHEIGPVTFVEQFVYNATIGECRSMIVYPATAPGVTGTFKQADFVLPSGYQHGSY